MKKLVGISLALVMLCGSVPLGFAEPLQSQIKQGIETSQLQCDNESHVLVLRNNGNMACVSERTAERTGWEILKTSDKLTFGGVFIKSDIENADIQLGLLSKSMEGKVIREPIQFPFSQHYIILESGSLEPTISDNLKTQLMFGMTSEEIEQSNPLKEIPLQSEKYLKYFPDYVPDGMELKFVAMLENGLTLIYAPINLLVDPYADTEYEIMDMGGIKFTITDNSNRYTPDEAKDNFYKLLDWNIIRKIF